jgi:dihydrofolate reductase
MAGYVSLIVAMSENRVIGRDGALPWHLSADLRRFKRLTMGHHLIMGRRTYQSIGRPLPGRTSIVLTRQTGFSAPHGVLLARDWPQARQLAAEDPEVFVIGGGEVYRQALTQATRIYLTLVHASLEGDTYFPDFDTTAWHVVEETGYAADARNPLAHTFRILHRKDSP